MTKELEGSREGAGKLGKKCLGKEMETRLKREEKIEERSFRASILDRFLGRVKYSFDMVLVRLKEILSAQFLILTSDNQLLRCSHGGDRWLDLSQFGILPRNIVDGKYGGCKQEQGS